MPTVSFTISTANLNEIKAALAHHQGVDSTTNADVKEWMARQVRGMVRNYREAQRDAATPIDESDVVA